MANIPQQGTSIPTTQNWNVEDITSLSSIDPNLKDVLIKLYRNLNIMALAINYKESGMYMDTERYINSSLFSDQQDTNEGPNLSPRPIYRTVIDIGALPNSTFTTVAHDIEIIAGYRFIGIFGGASKVDGSSFIPLGQSSSTANENIKIEVTATDVITTTTKDYSAYFGLIILMYVKTEL